MPLAAQNQRTMAGYSQLRSYAFVCSPRGLGARPTGAKLRRLVTQW
jgi:hypothetical protein